MGAPRHWATLERFIRFASDLDEELRVYAHEPWAPTSSALATAGPARPSMTNDEAAQERERIASVFGEQAAQGGESALPALPLFFEVDQLQKVVRRLRRGGLKDHAELCARVIALARER